MYTCAFLPVICAEAISLRDLAGNQSLQGNSDIVQPPPSAHLSVTLILNQRAWFLEHWQMEYLAFLFMWAASERQDALLLTPNEFCLINLPDTFTFDVAYKVPLPCSFCSCNKEKNLPRSAVGLLFFIIHRLCC